MADLSKIALDGTTYNVKDTVARNKIWLPTGGTAGQVLCKTGSASGSLSWHNPDDLFPNSYWYLPNGIYKSNVVAAYDFVGASSETDALKNVNDDTFNGELYELTNTGATFVRYNGFYFPPASYLAIPDYNEFVGYDIIESTMWDGSVYTTFNYNGNRLTSLQSVVFGYRYATSPAASKCSVGSVVSDYMLYTRTWRGSSNYYTYPTAGKCDSTSNKHYVSALEYDRGVLGCNFVSATSFDMFLNGMPLSLTQYAGITPSNHKSMVIGQNTQRTTENTTIPAYVTAIVFYNTVLTRAQHLELYNNIVALGGGID